MTRGEMKLRARSLILTNPPRPHPCLVTLALLAFIWIVNYLAQKIGGQPILIDLNADPEARLPEHDPYRLR